MRTNDFRSFCENQKGEKFIIELQNVKQDFVKDRSIYYSTFPIQAQGPKGKDWNYYLKAIYTVGILNFSFPDKVDRYKREIQLIDIATCEVFYDKLTFIYMEMPKFQKSEEELETQLEKWMYILKNLSKSQERPVKLQERIFEKLFLEAEIAKLNAEDMKAYEESLKVYWDNYSVLETAKKEGRKEGILLVAKEMKKEGESLEKISRITVLTKEEIAKL